VLLQRSPNHALKKARISFTHDGHAQTLELQCKELGLYLFDTGIMIMKLRLEAADVDLELIQKFRETFRRAFMPYLPNESTHFPEHVTWVFSDSEQPIFSIDRDDCLKTFQHQHAAHMPKYWQYLLQPLTFAFAKKDNQPSITGIEQSSLFCYDHLGYEQIPTLSYISVNSPRALSRREHIKIAFSQSLDSIDYSDRFLETFESTYCYDRFYEAVGSSPLDTRFFVCAYAVTVLCDDSDFSLTDLRDNYEHHYAQLVLVAHLQRAVLLLLRSRLYQIIPAGAHSIVPGADLENEAIINDLIRFANSWRVSEVSNQEQGQDLYRRLLQQLNTEQLYSQLFEHSQSIFNFIQSTESARLGKTASKLTVVATLGLAVGLAFSFWGLGVFGSSDYPWKADARAEFISGHAEFWLLFVLSIFVCLVAVCIVANFWHLPERFLTYRERRNQSR
jgi:hypothetical protein